MSSFTANPLDRNHDGRVDLKDLHSNSGLNGAHHNPLDRNFDGRVNLKDLAPNAGLNQGLSQGAYLQGANRSSLGLVRAEPTIIETIQKDVVVHERIHPVQKEEIQPIIYREREQLDVKQVTQMLHETKIQPTIIQQRELPAERRAAVVERAAPIVENFIAPTSVVDATLRSQVVHAPIVNEVIKKKIIEEIQPVLERDIIQSTVIQNTQPIYEKFVDAPTVYRETRVLGERRLSGAGFDSLLAQGFNLGSLGVEQSTLAGSNLNSQLPLNSGLNSGLTSETYLPTAGSRRSLAEALPQSYGYLNNGIKLNETERLQREIAAAPLPSPIL